MTEVRRYAEKLLCAKHLISGEAAFPGYHPASEAGWWTDVPLEPAWGAAIGVHEAHAGRSESSFLVLEFGLLHFDAESRRSWIPYDRILRPMFEKLSKTPESTSIGILTTEGEVQFEFPLGGAFTFARFIRKVAGG